jgi:hypothetical protein
VEPQDFFGLVPCNPRIQAWMSMHYSVVRRDLIMSATLGDEEDSCESQDSEEEQDELESYNVSVG